MASDVIGRDDETEQLRAFLDDRVLDGPRALVLEGEAGIGKSTLWLAALELAREQGLRVLSSRPAEAEQDLAFAGFGDLFEGCHGDVLSALAPPRRRALEVALLVEEAQDPLDRRTLGVAVRSALELLAEAQPLLLAVDDVQWLDRSSADALAFALRRLTSPLHVLLTRRRAERKNRSELELALPAQCVARLAVGPLSVGAIQTLLRERLDRVFPRPTLLRIHETSGGNPLYALELARAYMAEGASGYLSPPLPVPETLRRVVGGRLDDLPEATLEALSLVSALGRASPALLRAAGVAEHTLEPALAAHVVELDDGNVRFTHPLLASVLERRQPAEQARRVHTMLAEVVEDPVARARHLALATDRPATDVAAALDQAVEVATARGAIAAAAELAEHAMRLTHAEDLEAGQRRVIAAARAHFGSGEADRARSLARDLVARAPGGPMRAEALVLVSELESEQELPAISALREALLEAPAPPGLQALIHYRLSLSVRATEGLAAAEDHARASVELAERAGDLALTAAATAALGAIRFRAGHPDAPDIAERAYELAANDDRQRMEAGMALADVLVWSAQLERARSLLEILRRESRNHDERTSARCLWYFAFVEWYAGHYELAAEYAKQARELSLQYGHGEMEAARSLLPVAQIAALRGELDNAREVAERACRLADDQQLLFPGLLGLVGVIESQCGSATAAVARYAAAERVAKEQGVGEPNLYGWRAFYVEALLELGRLDDAVEVLDEWETDAIRVRRDWVLAQVTRCRGLLAAARGEIEGAMALLEQAVARHEAVGDPFGRARALLALGVVRRRARQRSNARKAIEEAVAVFDECGAQGWAERARSELGRIGGRRREEGLTPAERRVAALVAEGRTNREVASALFLSARTVETHLTHIYAKLGVRSRAELVRLYGSASRA
jgi:DNA-binding CsgD family transcriptional regulator